MANPMTADQLVASLKRWGVKVVEQPGWRTNNRNNVGKWGPVNGSMVHHTASADGMGIVDVCFNGRPDLPGPLCTGVIRKNGTVYLVGNGRANHAGNGSTAVLDAVVNETPIPDRPGPDAVDGNARFYGWECVNLGDGEDPWPAVQLDVIARVQAAICEHHGWGAGSVIGHKEWTTRKIDPRGFTMVGMRSRVAAHLKAGPTPLEEDMTELTSAQMNEIAERVAARLLEGSSGVWTADVVPAARPPYHNKDWFEADGTTLKNTTWSAGYMQRAQIEGIRQAIALLADIKATLGVIGSIGSGTLADQVTKELEQVIIKLAVTS